MSKRFFYSPEIFLSCLSCLLSTWSSLFNVFSFLFFANPVYCIGTISSFSCRISTYKNEVNYMIVHVHMYSNLYRGTVESVGLSLAAAHKGCLHTKECNRVKPINTENVNTAWAYYMFICTLYYTVWEPDQSERSLVTDVKVQKSQNVSFDKYKKKLYTHCTHAGLLTCSSRERLAVLLKRLFREVEDEENTLSSEVKEH